ncbi:MAG: VOC family protein [Gemmatimonadaceae bacterium]
MSDSESHSNSSPRNERVPVRLFVPQPYLRVDNAELAIAFYIAAFNAQLVVKLVEPNGRVAHAELRLGEHGEASLMLSDEYPENNLLGPNTRGGSTVAMQVYVDNVDAVCDRVRAAGGAVMKPPTTDPFGDRGIKVVDPCGHEWLVSERVETITPEEMQERFNKMFAE